MVRHPPNTTVLLRSHTRKLTTLSTHSLPQAIKSIFVYTHFLSNIHFSPSPLSQARHITTVRIRSTGHQDLRKAPQPAHHCVRPTHPGQAVSRGASGSDHGVGGRETLAVPCSHKTERDDESTHRNADVGLSQVVRETHRDLTHHVSSSHLLVTHYIALSIYF